MDVQVSAAPVGDRRLNVERLLAEWRAAERELERLDPDVIAYDQAVQRVEQARQAYQACLPDPPAGH
jgi:hypothetical protein